MGIDLRGDPELSRFRPPSPEFIPTQYVDEVRIKRLNAPPPYRLTRDLDDISNALLLYSVAVNRDDCTGWDSLTRGSMMLRPRSPGSLPIPGAFSMGSQVQDIHHPNETRMSHMSLHGYLI
jgi:hypothetical protein